MRVSFVRSVELAAIHEIVDDEVQLYRHTAVTNFSLILFQSEVAATY
jgi:hypothetical protein